jgi:hypothetical protein
MEASKPRGGAKAALTFNAQAFLDSAGLAKKIVEYGRGDTIFTQGDPCEDVLYIQTGGVKLSVLSKTGREAVVAMLRPGDFFGEGCLACQPNRMGSATAIPGRPVSTWRAGTISLTYTLRGPSVAPCRNQRLHTSACARPNTGADHRCDLQPNPLKPVTRLIRESYFGRSPSISVGISPCGCRSRKPASAEKSTTR